MNHGCIVDITRRRNVRLGLRHRLDIWRRPSSVMILGDMRGFGVDVKAFDF